MCNAASTFSAVAAEEATYYDIDYADVLSDMKSWASTWERVYRTMELLIFFHSFVGSCYAFWGFRDRTTPSS